MHTHCHRCVGELSPGDEVTTFCPHCGAPQLYLPDYESAKPAEVPATGFASPGATHPQRIDWQAALRSAALVSGIAAMLSVLGLRFPVCSFLSLCWTLTASMTTLALYQRQRPSASMNTRIGARIGVATGILLGVSITVASTIAGIVARFSLHAMGPMDAQLIQVMQQVSEQVSRSAPASPELPAVLRFIASPEFRAGYVLLTALVGSLFLLLLSTLGGAVGGLLRTRRRIAQ